jgi:hypothetical protein
MGASPTLDKSTEPRLAVVTTEPALNAIPVEINETPDDVTPTPDGAPNPEQVPDWRAVGRLLAAAIPIVAVLLPVSGYIVRLIGLSKPWIPTEVILYVTPGELAVTGAFALAGGWVGFLFFGYMWLARERAVNGPFYVVTQTWRDYGLTRTRARAIRSWLARLAKTIRAHRWRRATWAVLRRRVAVSMRRIHIPTRKRRALVPILRIGFAAFSIAASVWFVASIINGTLGVSVGTALQIVAMYWGWWRLSVISRQHGKVDLLRVIPTALIVIVLAGVGAGLNYSYAHRPAEYTFSSAAGTSNGVYQEVGNADSFAYLVPCGPPVTPEVIVVHESQIVGFRPTPSFTPTKRNTILGAITSGVPLDLGYRPCD